ncbi:TonB-dependent receptor [Caulobacter endophyticus]|uniref:TonB-dependent receptor n=1 Tax=Caulobacter endophyticus TaxID=2172652 RepID=UPI00240FCA91|nr:TonB-dependent receptor [Caulobacter endophyticus]
MRVETASSVSESGRARRLWLVSAATTALAASFATTAFSQDNSAASGSTLAPDTVEEVVVRGIRASVGQSLAIKRESTQVVESVVAEDIGKLPDNNVVEALQRVTGVQVTNRSGGEATAISIRGLPDITTTWNGRNVFTASGRQFALQDIPANLVKRIDVYKTRSADQIETGIAGQVDVFTRRPFDFKGPTFSLASRGIWHEQADKFNPNVSALVANRWDTGAGEIGALLNVSYARTRYRDQSVTAGALVPFATADNPPAGWVPLERIQVTDARAPNPDGSLQTLWRPGLNEGLSTAPGSTLTINGVQVPYLLSRDAVFQSDLLGDRKRPAVNAALQWAPNDSAEYTFEFFYDGYRNTTFNNLQFTFVDWWGDLGANPGSSFTLFPGTNIIKSRTAGSVYGFNSGDLTVAKTDSFVYALNGKWRIGERLELVGDLSYQTSKFSSAFMAMRTDRVARQVSVNFNPGDGITSFHFDDDSQLADPTRWNVAEFYDNANRNKGDAVTVSLDGDYNAGWGPLKTLSFGFRYDDRGTSEAQRTQSAFLGRPLSSLPSGLQWVNQGFFDGHSDTPTRWVVANGYYLRDHVDEIRALYHAANPNNVNFTTSENLSLFENFTVDEVTSSAYLMADFESELFGRRLRAQAGLRYVDVDTDMTFNDQAESRRLGSLVQTSAGKQVSDVLPSVTVRYDLTSDVALRFNYGKTLRRPDFSALNPNYTLVDDLTDVGYGTATGGNANLEPTRATNYDLTAEWYFASGSALYATAFRREIDGLVVSLRSRRNIPNTTNNTQEFVLTQPANASDGVLKGLEVGLVYFPKNLPGYLDGLGFLGSLTKLSSSQNVPDTNDAGEIVGQKNSAFFGVSDFSYNVTLAYERGPIGARLSYVWRDDFLANNEAALFANPIGVWRKPERSLDMQVSYKVNDRLSMTFDAVNLTEEIAQSYYAFGEAGGPDTHNFGSSLLSRTFAFGLRYQFD